MKLRYSIKEEMDIIDKEYGFRGMERLESKAIECLYNRCFEQAKIQAKNDISKVFNLSISVDNGEVIAVLG